MRWSYDHLVSEQYPPLRDGTCLTAAGDAVTRPEKGQPLHPAAVAAATGTGTGTVDTLSQRFASLAAAEDAAAAAAAATSAPRR